MGTLRTLSCAVLLVACGKDDFPQFPEHDGQPQPDAPAIDAPPDIDAPPPIDAAVDAGLDAPPSETDPPVIILKSPDAGSLVSGTFTFEVEVQDASQIAAVTATIAGTTQITMVSVGATTRFRGAVDTVPLAGLVSPPIVVRARDFGGTEGELGFTVVLDNEGPLVALDPPFVRSSRFNQDVLECSRDYDPVGNDAPNDLEIVPQLIEFRARVLDLSNTGTVNSTLFVPRAGVKRVQLFVLDDTTQPLVVDTEGDPDDDCDDINPDIVPASVPVLANEAAVLELSPVPPTGAAFFAADTFGGSNASCSAGADTEAPARLCLGEAATIAIADLAGDPQIFGLSPIDDFNCMGFAFDAAAANISDGFACAAVLVEDNLGNRRVSAPLRVCVRKDGSGTACAGVAPNCTGTVVGGVVTTTPCSPRGFPLSGQANDFEEILQP